MNAQDAGPVRARRHLAEGGEELLFGSRDEGREVRRDARLEQSVSCAPVSVGIGFEQVDAVKAVDLEVDEARCCDPLAVR